MKITKKLRDVTKEEYSKWKRSDCCSGAVCYKCPFYNVSCCEDSVDSWVNHKDLYNDKFLDQTIEVEVPDILNKEEKEYLSAVIKPFRDKIKAIKKETLISIKKEFIRIIYKEDDSDNYFCAISLPEFGINTMYKGMEKKKEYTLEELGL